MKNDPVQTAIARIDDLDPHTPEGRNQLAKALTSKSNLIAAKAARRTAEALSRDLVPQLAASFDRFISVALPLGRAGAPLDKGCAGSLAIARALVSLDHDDADLFRRGMRHVQMEGTWGGSEDTAAELRAVCAMGLANSSDAHKLRDMVALLVDPLWPARAGAVRALIAIGSPPAALLLRYKALLGDDEPEVLSDALTGLIELEGGEALPLCLSLADSRDPRVREPAILALGESRRNDAIDYLTRRFGEVADRDTKRCILLALASSRTEAAIGFLLDLIRNGSPANAAAALSALTIHRADPQLQDAIRQAESGRDGAPVPPNA